MSLLILGGTAEARELAAALGGRAILSLAGVTKRPLATPHRLGGFGGAAGLAAYLSAAKISAVIDATHPFATQMSRHAAQATEQTGLPLLRLQRPEWPISPDWQLAADLPMAAARLPAGARVFLSVGSRSLAPFLHRRDIWFLTRCIEPPGHSPHGEVLLAHPPFTLAAETALLKAHKITHLVSKNAGGGATRAKLDAAKALGIEVIMVNRPQLPGAFEVASVARALNWVAQQEGKS